MSIQNKPMAFIDVETTGLEAGYHEIIEICIRTDKTTYHEKVKPSFLSRISPKAMEINGYNPKGWINAVEPKEAAKNIAYILQGHIICGHNPHFDLDFIQDLCWRHKVDLSIDRRTIDTQTLAYVHLVPMGLHSLSLDNIRRFLGWEVRTQHNAWDDLFDTQRLYFALSHPWERFKIWLRTRFKK